MASDAPLPDVPLTLGTLAIFRGLTKILGNAQTIRIEDFGVLGVTMSGVPSTCTRLLIGTDSG